MNNLPDNPQPISPEIQAYQLSQKLISKLVELKKAYDPEKIQQIQIQLQEIGQEIISVGTNHIIKELHNQRGATYEEFVARSESGFKKMNANITDTVQNPQINTGSMNYGWDNLPAKEAINLFQAQSLKESIHKQEEKIYEHFVDFHHDDTRLKLHFIERLETISEARGFVINLSTKSQETK